MCWMCKFHGEPVGRKMQEFAIRNIGFMDMHCISSLITDYVLLHVPGAEDVDVQTVYTHVESHMLHPRVRTAVLLRQLLQFASLIQGGMVIRQDEICTIDKSNAELYLKVVAQIMTMYKMDPSSMLFSDETTQEAPGLSAEGPEPPPNNKRRRVE